MKRKLIIYLFFAIPLSGISQTINETVDYVNSAIQESTKSAERTSLISKITVTDNGKIIKNAYLIVPNYERLIESRSAYLKALEFQELKIVHLENSTNYVIILKCKSSNNCILRQVKGQSGDNVSTISLTLYNKTYAERAKNAILHLLELSTNNDNYLTKDPFN